MEFRAINILVYEIPLLSFPLLRFNSASFFLSLFFRSHIAYIPASILPPLWKLLILHCVPRLVETNLTNFGKKERINYQNVNFYWCNVRILISCCFKEYNFTKEKINLQQKSESILQETVNAIASLKNYKITINSIRNVLILSLVKHSKSTNGWICDPSSGY